jgi:ATP-dependent Lhr-like helicase
MRNEARRSVEAVTPACLMRFLVEWQHVGPGNRLLGTGGLSEVIEQLQGYEVPVGALESSILPARVGGYSPSMLDELCARGEVGFGRLSLRPAGPEAEESSPQQRRPGSSPSPATPLSLYRREDLDWLLPALRGDGVPQDPALGAPADVVAALRQRGALFLTDLCNLTGRMPVEVADALWEGIQRGIVTADGFGAVRLLLAGRSRLGNLVRNAEPGSLRRPFGPAGRGAQARRTRLAPALAGGRWSLIEHALALGVDRDGARDAIEQDELAEALAGQLLNRWGVVFRDLAQREVLGIGWREVLLALRRLEARGLVMGGRFVSGFVGEQFALPEAYEKLRSVARAEPDDRPLKISAADPLNLTGLIIPGPRVPATRTKSITLVNGVVSSEERASLRISS